MVSETKIANVKGVIRSPQPVWDLFVRGFHWSLVASISIAAVTGFLLGPVWVPVHIAVASFAVLLVLLRIIWGFAGGTYARFSSFITGPLRLMRYARSVLSSTEARYVGHNPLGGAMVVVLLALVLGAGFTGWAFLGAGAKLGPFAFFVPYADSPWIAELHKTVAFGILGLVVLHVAGVFFTGKREGENLVVAMVTGEKAIGPQDISPPEHEARQTSALVAGLLVVGLLLMGIVAPMVLPVPGAPVSTIDPVARSECSDCHMFYHPSLLPARDWQQIMAVLDDHYGEDASLDPDTTAAIRDWLMANAAETADTRAASVFHLDPENGITRITETPFWKARHGGIRESAFKNPEVGSRSNCAACHGDAERGWFNPFFAEVEG